MPVLQVTVRWDDTVLASRSLGDGDEAWVGVGPDSVAQLPCESLGVSRLIVAKARSARETRWQRVRRRLAEARRPDWASPDDMASSPGVSVAFVPDGVLGFHERPGAVPSAIIGPREIELHPGEAVSFDLGSFRVTVAVSPSEQAPWSGRARFRGMGAPGAYAAVAAGVHAAVLLIASESANAAVFEPDPDVDAMSRYLAAAESRAAANETVVQSHDGAGQARFVDGKNGNGGESGGAHAAGAQGSMGRESTREGKSGRYSMGGASSAGVKTSRAEALTDAKSFGMAGLLASESARGPVSSFAEVAAKGMDAIDANGRLWAPSIGDTFGSGGLGLSGVGEGGGGQYQGIGLGQIRIGYGMVDGLYTGGSGSGLRPRPSWGQWGPYSGPHCGYARQRCGFRAGPPIFVQFAPPSLRALRPGATPPDPGHVLRAAATARTTLEACYRPLVSWDADRGEGMGPEGTVVTSLVIDDAGRVLTAGNTSSTFAGPEIARCVTNALRRVSYGQESGGFFGAQIPIFFRFGHAKSG